MKFIIFICLFLVSSILFAATAGWTYAPNHTLLPPLWWPTADDPLKGPPGYTAGKFTTAKDVPAPPGSSIQKIGTLIHEVTPPSLVKALKMAARFGLPIEAAIQGTKWLMDCDGGELGAECRLRPAGATKQPDGRYTLPAGSVKCFATQYASYVGCGTYTNTQMCQAIFGDSSSPYPGYTNGAVVVSGNTWQQHCGSAGGQIFRFTVGSCPAGSTLVGSTCYFDPSSSSAQTAANAAFATTLAATSGKAGKAAIQSIADALQNMPVDQAAPIDEALRNAADTVTGGVSFTLQNPVPFAVPEPNFYTQPDSNCGPGNYLSADGLCYPIDRPVLVPVDPSVDYPEIRLVTAVNPQAVTPPPNYTYNVTNNYYYPNDVTPTPNSEVPIIDPVIDPATGFDMAPLLQPSPAPDDPEARTTDEIKAALNTSNFPLLDAIKGWQLPAHNSQCALGSFNFSIAAANFSQDFSLQPICDRFEEYKPNISAFFLFIWSILPIFVVLRS